MAEYEPPRAQHPLVAERDQLRQQVEKLLGAVGEHQKTESFYCNKCGYFGPVQVHEEARGCTYYASGSKRDVDLYAAADQVRKELGE